MYHFSPACNLSRRGFDGVAYRAVKSDTPSHGRRRITISVSAQIGAGEFPRSAHALPVVVGEEDFDEVQCDANFVFIVGRFQRRRGERSTTLTIR